jgi:hypothetical protein
MAIRQHLIPCTAAEMDGRNSMNNENKNGLMCSWCRRIKDEEEGWIFPVEIDEMAVIDPLISHGLCDDCYGDIIDDFMAPVRAAEISVPVSGS